MLNSVEHEILNAHKYKKISGNTAFLGSDNPRMLFFPLVNCWHFNISEQEKVHAQLS